MRAWTAAMLAAGAAAAAPPDWSGVDAVLVAAIGNLTFPGCAAAVMDATGAVVYARAFGNFTYGEPTPVGGNDPPVDVSTTLFDMASVTKIIGATTTSALLYQAGLLDLDMPISDPSLLGPAYAVNGKGTILVRDCLLHQAGYPPDPDPNYWDAAFACPATAMPNPPLTFNCSELIFASLLAQTLQYPPTTQWLYSDLSMITMQYVVGTVVAANALVTPAQLRPDCAGADPTMQPGLYKSCYFEAYVRVAVLQGTGMLDSQFLPSPSRYALAMPTWNETDYRHGVIQGVVSDGNSYALGGIAGHAGVFATLNDMTRFVQMWGYSPAMAGASNAAAAPRIGALPPTLVNATTQSLYFTNPRPAFGPRALGWVTQAATDTYLGCGNFSASTVYHTGYTGTLLCIDPTTSISSVLLTNRVYPNSTGNANTVHAARQAYNNAVLVALGITPQLPAAV